MVENNVVLSEKIPEKDMEKIEGYKNTITNLSLETGRLNKLKIQKEIEISSLDASIEDKKEKVKTATEQLEKVVEQLKDSKEEKKEVDKFVVDENKKIIDRKKELEEEVRVFAVKEKENKEEREKIDTDKKSINAKLTSLNNEKEEVDKKIKLIKEFSSKL